MTDEVRVHRATPPFPGLDAEGAARRLITYGPNRLSRPSRWARVKAVLEPLTDPMAVMLGVAAAAYMLLGETTDGIILLVALVPVLGIDVVLERRSHKALEQLARAVAPQARVVRGGVELDVPSEHLVPGDVVILREGHVVHGDGVVKLAANVSMDESALTGESEPQGKSPVAPGIEVAATLFFAGSTVLSGHGFGEVTATGTSTRFGAIAKLLTAVADEPTPLQKQTLRLVRVVGFMALGVAGVVFAVALARGGAWKQALLSAVSLAMAAVPEEFPLVFTLFLTLGAFRL
ncbi:MAG: cation-transporting P-type ATPase, partial [Deltaproteobacteria bacterium]